MPASNRSFATGTSNAASLAGARSVALSLADRPDMSYWTAYDHFMIEREARAMRRAFVWSLVAKGWQALRRRFATITPAQRGHASAPHARLMHR